jgi:hypothetical protein
MIPSAIVALLNTACPSTITWFIVTVVVDAVESFADGPLAHIRNESLKRM